MKLVCNKDTKRKDIVNLIRHTMIDCNMKNADIAKGLGYTTQSVSNLLNNSYRPDSSMTVDQLASICDVMDCDLVVEIVKRDKDSNKD